MWIIACILILPFAILAELIKCERLSEIDGIQDWICS